MTLIDPTDEDLERMFAVRIAGWTDIEISPMGKSNSGKDPQGYHRQIPRYTRSADAAPP